MYTHPAYSRSGVGRLILTLCEQAAKEEGFKRLELMGTMSGEPLYTKYGLVPIETSCLGPDRHWCSASLVDRGSETCHRPRNLGSEHHRVVVIGSLEDQLLGQRRGLVGNPGAEPRRNHAVPVAVHHGHGDLAVLQVVEHGETVS